MILFKKIVNYAESVPWYNIKYKMININTFFIYKNKIKKIWIATSFSFQ